MLNKHNIAQMNISHSINCMISDQFRLWVDRGTAKQLFDIVTTVGWIEIDHLPPIIQVYNFYPTVRIHCLIALTVAGQLLIIDRMNPNGVLINCSVKSIMYIDSWKLSNSDTILMIIDDMNRIYIHSIPSLIEGRNRLISPELLGKNVTSIAYLNSKCMLWISESHIFRYNGTIVTKLETSFEPYRLIDKLLIDTDNRIYRIDTGNDIHFVKILRADYEVRDMINYPGYHDLSIIDDEGYNHVYRGILGNNFTSSKREKTKIKRFIHIHEYMPSIIMKSGETFSYDNEPLENLFQLIDLDEHYRKRIKSAT